MKSINKTLCLLPMIAVLASCSCGRSITLEEASAKADEIISYRNSTEVLMPNTYTMTGVVETITDGVKTVEEHTFILSNDLDSKTGERYVYICNSSQHGSDRKVVSEQWMYRDNDKTITAKNADGKKTYFTEGFSSLAFSTQVYMAEAIYVDVWELVCAATVLDTAKSKNIVEGATYGFKSDEKIPGDLSLVDYTYTKNDTTTKINAHIELDICVSYEEVANKTNGNSGKTTYKLESYKAKTDYKPNLKEYTENSGLFGAILER